MIDWTHGYACDWRVYEVDVATWADGQRLGGFRDASVSRDLTGDAPLIESGSLHLDAPIGTDTPSRYIRLAMVATQGGASERVDVCTLRYERSSATAARGVDDVTLNGRSVLHPASVANTWMHYGTYAPAGGDAVAIAARMLQSTIQAPVTYDGTATLASNVVFGRDETVLASVWRMLSAAGISIRIDGRGRVHVGPRPSNPALTLDRASVQLVSADGIARAHDVSGVPNRYTVWAGDVSATTTNEDDGSTSRQARGYWHDIVDSSPALLDGEALDTYAARRLRELSHVKATRDYEREWWPDVTVGDVVRGSVRSVGLDGDMRVVRQSLTCGAGIVVREESEMEVYE